MKEATLLLAPDREVEAEKLPRQQIIWLDLVVSVSNSNADLEAPFQELLSKALREQ